jgi:hypothetical protein
MRFTLRNLRCDSFAQRHAEVDESTQRVPEWHTLKGTFPFETSRARFAAMYH